MEQWNGQGRVVVNERISPSPSDEAAGHELYGYRDRIGKEGGGDRSQAKMLWQKTCEFSEPVPY
jgi:hypothetical protein